MKVTLSDWKGTKIETLRRLGISLGASLVILIFSLCAPPNAELFDMIGMELAIVALGILLCRFPVGTYLMVNLFTLSAAAGSILKLYDKFPGYDRVVHFISGLILGYIGVYIGEWLFKRLSVPREPFIIILFAGLFSCTCAGAWEIIEFLTDCVMHMGVQHGNSDTMGDIVAGYLGCILFQMHKLHENRAYFSKERIRSFFKSEMEYTASSEDEAEAVTK